MSVYKRKILVSILLSLLTCGVYALYWMYLLVANVRALKNDKRKCTGEMLCILFVPFYICYWWYAKGNDMKRLLKQHQCDTDSDGLLYLGLSIIGLSFVAMIMMQNDINRLPLHNAVSPSRKQGTSGMIKSTSLGDRIYLGAIWGIVIFLTLLCLLPLIHMVALSFSARIFAEARQVAFWPVGFHLEAYKAVMADIQYIRSFGISVARVTVGTFFNLIALFLMAFPLSHDKKRFPSRNIYMLYTLFCMMFGGGLVPWYFTMRDVGFVGNFWGLVMPCIPFGNMILMMNAMRNIPKPLRESAELDGAANFRLLFNIYIPLTIPTLAVIILYSVVGHWNEFFAARILIKKTKDLPLMSYIYSLRMTDTQLSSTLTVEEIKRMQNLGSIGFESAKIVVASVPLLLIYPLIQRYFIGGIQLGAVKE